MMGNRGRLIPAARVHTIERQIRNRGGRSYRQLAKSAEVGLATISRIATGKHSTQRRKCKRCPGCGGLCGSSACLVCAANAAKRNGKLKAA